ncbi:MAG: hypothetical protein JO049_07535 [Hyphomicrobiales bacterium]|nr:hypothetical protein [Hyphomicrobiales bacterium]
MSDCDVSKVIDKLRKLRALRQARERVRQLESELYGAPSRPQDLPRTPEFLSEACSLQQI